MLNERTFTRSVIRVHSPSDVAALAHVRVVRGAGGGFGRRTVRALAHIRYVMRQWQGCLQMPLTQTYVYMTILALAHIQCAGP